jgi:hypothetical protein
MRRTLGSCVNVYDLEASFQRVAKGDDILGPCASTESGRAISGRKQLRTFPEYFHLVASGESILLCVGNVR